MSIKIFHRTPHGKNPFAFSVSVLSVLRVSVVNLFWFEVLFRVNRRFYGE